MIDWASETSHWMVNPRLTAQEKQQLHEMQRAAPHLSGHFWLMTSGSTGRFKWVALSKNALLASAEAVNAHLQSDVKDCWINPLPTFHVGGLGIFARSALSGARCIDCSGHKWDVQHFHRRMVAENATLTALVPAQLYDLVREGLKAPELMRAVIVGGGAVSPALLQQAMALNWKVLPSYGMTECASQVATASLNAELPHLTLLPHVQVRIEESGMIAIKSPALFTGYADGERFYDPKEEGWFRTEDRGSLKGDRLELYGRGGDFLKIGGESINFAQLEQLLESIKLRHLVSADLALVAVPDVRLGHVIHLAVDRDSEFVQKVVAQYQSQVLPFEAIRKVHFMDELPRTPLGKLNRQALLERLMDATHQVVKINPG